MLRTVFLADYFVNAVFRRELLRVLNRGEAVNALKRARRSSAMPPELIGRIAPTRTEGINLRGLFRFPIEQYAGQLLPSLPAVKSAAGGR
jgi:hypothetical protein